MTFEELKDGMKSMFFSLGAKTSDSNYGVALLDKTSGEPKGLMGMSDLASVLGVGTMNRKPVTGYISDLNDQVVWTWCAASSDSSNIPNDASTSDKAYFCFGTPYVKLQIGGRNGIYHMRIFLNGDWGVWVRL